MNAFVANKRILLCVTGMSPQVVTETLYALVTEKHFIPTEIQLITTLHGKNRAIRDLLDERDGHFHAFCRDYLPETSIHFDESCIHVITGSDGIPLSDIQTPEENSLAADTIMGIVRSLCMDESNQLHVSIAGGRKSMGFFVGYALSLFARPQDELSHVLVSEPYENNRDFFYPPPCYRELVRPDGSILDASQAKIMLATIPLVHLRSGLPSSLLDGGSYSETVMAAQKSILLPLEMIFDVKNKTVTCAGQVIKMQPSLFAMLLWLAMLKKKDRIFRPNKESELKTEFLDVYAKVTPRLSLDYENAAASLENDRNFIDYFREKYSRINKRIRSVLGQSAKHFSIISDKKRPASGYSLATPAEAIVIHF